MAREPEERYPVDARRDRDMILVDNEFTWMLDKSKNRINTHVGPDKITVGDDLQPMRFDGKKFIRCTQDEAVQRFPVAPQGWYLVLKNPAQNNANPKPGEINTSPQLNIGKKINIPGPVSMPAWPGQMWEVIEGHRLRSNQYLVAEVYDDEAAKENWSKAIVQTKDGELDPDLEVTNVNTLSNGQRIIIKGTDVSFFIPPSGIKVVKGKQGYFHEAVTLERLEYCILKGEDGNKRYTYGPDVVFPGPTERFLEIDGERKFRALELNEISGVYVKVIADYVDDAGQKYKSGDELFITGKEQMIYFPRPEHAIVKYGEQEKHFAVAIPTGQGRYVLNRSTGEIRLERGPKMFLADPRKEVIVKRVLDQKTVDLWYPGNAEAMLYNEELAKISAIMNQSVSASNSTNYLTNDMEAAYYLSSNTTPIMYGAQSKGGIITSGTGPSTAKEKYAGDQFARKSTYTPPRSLILNDKYEGAPSIDVWNGYAVKVINKNGESQVLVGPATHLMEYDEYLEVVTLSTKTPKTEDNTTKTVYLKVKNNRVSDKFVAETSDMCSMSIHMSYRVNFSGDQNQWFDVDNYVQFLCDNVQSLVFNAVRKRSIDEMDTMGVDIIRELILGKQSSDGRPGRTFEENGMVVYDVEVLDLSIKNDEIHNMFKKAQNDSIRRAIDLKERRHGFQMLTELNKIERETLDIENETQVQKHNAAMMRQGLEFARREKSVSDTHALDTLEHEAKLALELIQTNIEKEKLERDKEKLAQDFHFTDIALDQSLKELKGKVDAMTERAKAISPQFISALQSFSDKDLLAKVSQSMAPLAILGGKSVLEVARGLLKGTSLEKVLGENE